MKVFVWWGTYWHASVINLATITIERYLKVVYPRQAVRPADGDPAGSVMQRKGP